MSVFLNVHVFSVHNFAIIMCRFFDLSTNKIRDGKLLANLDFKTFGSEIATRGVLWKKVFLEISQNSQENTFARDSFLIKLQPWGCNFIKRESLTKVFSCEFCEISKNTFFIEHLRTTAFVLPRSRHEILSLSDCNWAWTYKHLVHKRTLNHLAKPFSQ